MTVLALVPARGGSRGLRGKNLRTVGGVSLVARAVQVAQESGVADVVVVSSDDDAVLTAAEAAGAVAERRPDRLATDTARSVDVALHHLREHPEADTLVLLQPTSPLRNASDVRSCVQALARTPSAVTVTQLAHPWQWTTTLDADGRLVPVSGWEAFGRRRQDLPTGYTLNGAVYAARRSWLVTGETFVGEETVGVLMPPERSVDVDTEQDLAVARSLWAWAHRSGS